MSCTRCGQNRPRPIVTPTIVGRPGGVSVPSRAPRPVGGGISSGPLPSSTIRNAITGLRYIPNGGGK